MSRRDHIPLKVKLAAALCVIGEIPYLHAKRMTPEQVLSLFQWDHWPFPKGKPYNGPDAHWNLSPRLIKAHREKTATVDQPLFAKTRRVTAENEEFRRKMLAKAGQPTAPAPRSKPKRKIKSRGFTGWRRFNGDTVRRKEKRT